MSFQKYIGCISVLTICLLIIGQESLPAAAGKIEVPQISADRLKELIGQPQTVIIDVRRTRSWWRSSKKITAAVREDPSRVEQWAPKYAADLTLIFYCS